MANSISVEIGNLNYSGILKSPYEFYSPDDSFYSLQKQNGEKYANSDEGKLSKLDKIFYDNLVKYINN